MHSADLTIREMEKQETRKTAERFIDWETPTNYDAEVWEDDTKYQYEDMLAIEAVKEGKDPKRSRPAPIMITTFSPVDEWPILPHPGDPEMYWWRGQGIPITPTQGKQEI